MTWYIWTWGIISSVACGVWIAAGLAWWAEWRSERKFRENDLERQREIDTLRGRIISREMEIERLKRHVSEAKKGQNEFGRISP